MAENNILKRACRDIVYGDGEGAFGPERAVCRTEIAQLMVQTLGLDVGSETHSFTDTLPELGAGLHPTAVEAGLFTGYEDGSFRAHQHLARPELAAVLVRAAGVATESPGHPLEFTAAATISPWL